MSEKEKEDKPLPQADNPVNLRKEACSKDEYATKENKFKGKAEKERNRNVDKEGK